VVVLATLSSGSLGESSDVVPGRAKGTHDRKVQVLVGKEAHGSALHRARKHDDLVRDRIGGVAQRGLMSSRVSRGYGSRRSASVAPSDLHRTSSTTGALGSPRLRCPCLSGSHDSFEL
jgi:hypothetical protein